MFLLIDTTEKQPLPPMPSMGFVLTRNWIFTSITTILMPRWSEVPDVGACQSRLLWLPVYSAPRKVWTSKCTVHTNRDNISAENKKGPITDPGRLLARNDNVVPLKKAHIGTTPKLNINAPEFITKCTNRFHIQHSDGVFSEHSDIILLISVLALTVLPSLTHKL